MAKWVRINERQAHGHPLYGRLGWLAFFLYAQVIGLLISLVYIQSVAHDIGISLAYLLQSEEGVASFIRLTMGWNVIMVGAVLWMAYSLEPRFRQNVTILYLIAWPLDALFALYADFPGAAGVLAQSFTAWGLSCAVWLTYVQRSRRVRVTFESSVRHNDPYLEAIDRVDAGATSTGPGEYSEALDFTGQGTAEYAANANASSAEPVSSTQDAFATHRLWSAALDEFEGDGRDRGLWARLFAEAEGDESRAKAAYLSARVEQLKAGPPEAA